jgi:hypothetical protein
LFIKHPSNTYFNSKGEKTTLSEVIFELRNPKLEITKIKTDWENNKLVNKPSVIDLFKLRDNAVIRELKPVKPKEFHASFNEFDNKQSIAKEQMFSTIQIFSRRMNVNKQNDLRNAFIVIKETNPKLYDDLIKVAINQSGIHHYSPISYSNIIPNEEIKVILDESFKRFSELADSDKQNLLDQFETQFLSRNLKYLPHVNSTKKGAPGENDWFVR